MQSIRQIERLNQTELDKCIPSNASWHTDYRDTAYLYIGGLPFELSEGDILTIFSQYGNPVHINLVRDKDTGKSRGFCFLKYEDQRSCDLAVDNLSGAGVMGRVISVDHTRYKKKEGEIEGIGDEGEEEDGADDTDREGDERRKRRRTNDSEVEGGEEEEEEEDRPLIKEELELQKLLRDHDDDDPMKEYLVKEKREQVAEALRAVVKLEKSDDRLSERRQHKHRHHHHHHHRSRPTEYSEDGDRSRHRHRSRKERHHDEDDGEKRSRHREHSNGHDRRHRSRHDDEDDHDHDARTHSRRDESRSAKTDRPRRHRAAETDSEEDEHERRRRRRREHSS